MNQLKWLVKVSRPRFWPYLFGPFLIGLAPLGSKDIAGDIPLLVFMGLYFTFSANLLVYGINDVYDYETDKLNPKKQGYEALVKPSQHSFLATVIALSNIPFVATFLLWPSVSGPAKLSLVLFLFFGIGYSVPPLRAKVRPFVDTLFNSLYVFPALVSYGISTGTWPQWHIFVAAVFWCMAMHAYSAVPDIKSDKAAHVSTVATVLGAKATLLFCATCYALAGMLVFAELGAFSVVASSAYVGIMAVSYVSPHRSSVFRLYKLFPYINFTIGFLLFWYIVATMQA